MMATTHTVIGLAAFSTVAVTTGTPVTLPTLALAALGALTPDIDHTGSWLGRRTFPLSLLCGLLVGHRGATHSLLALGVVGLAAWIWASHLPSELALAFMVGYWSHLLADWNTCGGIPLLWPLKQKTCTPWAIQTGGAIELLVFFGFLGGFALTVWKYYNYSQLDVVAQQIGLSIHCFIRSLF